VLVVVVVVAAGVAAAACAAGITPAMAVISTANRQFKTGDEAGKRLGRRMDDSPHPGRESQ
jgi:hypothetical protein